MAYGTVDGVRGYLPQGQAIDDQTGRPPNSQQITTMIAALSSLWDVVFGATTDPDEIATRSYYTQREVVYQIMAIRGSVKDSKQPAVWLSYHEEWLALFPEGAIAAALSASGDLPWSFTADADDTDETDDRNPSFVKGYVP